MKTTPDAPSPWHRLPPLMLAFLLVASFPAGLPGTAPGPSPCRAEEAWRAEIEAVCAKTDVAESLTKKELVDLLDRCDRLTPLVEAEPEPARSFYLRRLWKCSDYYRFMLDSRGGR